MKKFVLLVVGLALVLMLISSLIPFTKDNVLTYTHRGWPLSYSKTTNTDGLCIGLEDEISDTNTDGGCFDRKFPINKTNLAADFAFWLALSSILGYGIYYYRLKDKNT